MERTRGYTNWIIRYRLLVLLGAGALAAISTYFCTRLSFDSSLEGWFLEDDPNIVAYREFLDRFVGDEISVVGVAAPDVFAPEVLAAIDRVTRAAAKAPHAHRVRSLTNVKVFGVAAGGGVEIRPLARRLPRTPGEAAALRREALQNPLLRGNLVAPDGRFTAVVVGLASGADLMGRKVAQAGALEQIIRREAGATPQIELHLTGTPALDKAFYDHNERDFRIILPVSSVVVLLIAFLIFRRFLFTIIPTIVVGLSLLITFGVMGALGLKVNILSSMVAALVLAVGVADAIHVLSDYRRCLLRGHERAAALQRSIGHLFLPCLFTSITTAVGFLSLLTSELRPIQEAGWQAALGVSVAFGLSMTLIPALLSFASPAPARLGAGRLNRLVTAAALRLGGLSGAASLKVLVAAALLVVLVLARLVLGGIDVGANPIEYFRPGDRIRAATELVDARLGGSTSIELTVEAPDGGLKDPAVLRRMERFQRWVETLPGVGRALSIVDYLKELNRVVHGGAMRHHVLPDSREAVAQYFVLLEGEEAFASLVQGNDSLGRVTALVSFSGSGELSRRLPEVERRLALDFPDDRARAKLTGFVKLVGDMEGHLVRSQIKSMLLAFVVISAMMFILLRSLRLGILAMIPNLVPILLGLGFMTTVGIGLDPGTVMIGSIALGLVVDDTVHFLVQLKRRMRAGGRLGDAIGGAMEAAGQPIIVTSLILIAGFLVGTLGSFNPNVNFGFISAVVILLALVADLVLLPAALRVLRPRLPTTGEQLDVGKGRQENDRRTARGWGGRPTGGYSRHQPPARQA